MYEAESLEHSALRNLTLQWIQARDKHTIKERSIKEHTVVMRWAHAGGVWVLGKELAHLYKWVPFYSNVPFEVYPNCSQNDTPIYHVLVFPLDPDSVCSKKFTWFVFFRLSGRYQNCCM